jgi:hypothetical protein
LVVVEFGEVAAFAGQINWAEKIGDEQDSTWRGIVQLSVV